MKHEENLEIVRRAAILANPEIAELKFGCLINTNPLDGDSGIVTVLNRCGRCPKHKDEKSCERYGKEPCDIEDALYVFGGDPDDAFGEQPYTMVIPEDGAYEIIGRPITALDVLLALGKTKENYYLRDDGTIFYWYAFEGNEGHSVKSTYITLDLRATLSSWDEASVAALAALLKNDE